MYDIYPLHIYPKTDKNRKITVHHCNHHLNRSDCYLSACRVSCKPRRNMYLLGRLCIHTYNAYVYARIN